MVSSTATDTTEFKYAEVYNGQDLPENWLQNAKLQLAQDDSVYQYILDTVTYPREPEPCRELRELTRKHLPGIRSVLMVSPDEAQLLRLLVKISGAKKAIEVGVLTGYSFLNIALALPPDGKVIGVDAGDDFDVGKPVFEKAGVSHKIEFHKCMAVDLLDSLLAEGQAETFDFAFVDADKNNYVHYHERLMKLVRVGGLLVYDNTLYRGLVTGKDPLNLLQHEHFRNSLEGITAINKVVAQDKRLDLAMLCVADGVTVCHRVS